MVKSKLSKNEKRIFLAGVVIALASGYISNIAVTSIYEFIQETSLTNALTLITSNVLLFGLCVLILRKIFK